VDREGLISRRFDEGSGTNYGRPGKEVHSAAVTLLARKQRFYVWMVVQMVIPLSCIIVYGKKY